MIRPRVYQSEVTNMAHIWTQDKGAWKDVPLDGGVMDLPSARLMLSKPEGSAAHAAPDLWVLVAASATPVRVNGERSVGLRVLADRDEIRIADVSFYFSTERLAVVVPFPGPSVHCARCKLLIPVDSPAVSCPGCSSWHHQSDEYPCWTYADHCALCPWKTNLDAGYQWRPEEV